MPQIITYSDYANGELKLTFSTFQQTDFNSYAAYFEKHYLRTLLTDQLQSEIYSLVSLTGKYADLINGCYYIDTAGTRRTNIGLKELLKRFIYYHYTADNYQVSSTGKEKNQNENATTLNNAENRAVIYTKYNGGVDIWNNDVLLFLYEFYTQENNVDSYIDLGGSCQILSSDTKYLINGDTVYINGIAYVVSNVIDDVSFEITGTGLTPTGIYTYYPFKDVELIELEHAWL